MAAIDRAHLETSLHDPDVAARWVAFAQRVTDWAATRRLALRDTIVLLPFAQLLAPARAVFGRSDTWLPRIETTQTLARSLGPAPRAQALQLSLDPGADLLTASQLLEGQAWGREWSRRDPHGFARAVDSVVDTAQALWRAASAIAPSQRAGHWARARALLAPVSGPGATERLLARFALEWAALGVDPGSDRLFDLQAPGWVVLQAGGPDALALALLEAAPDAAACLLVDTDPPPDRLLPSGATIRAPHLAVCAGFEDEARCAAAQVIQCVTQGQHPVALIAQDRVLVRRVRALLEQAGVGLLDETGWTLSTTRAAGRVMTLLRAAVDGAGTDALFDWLKGVETWPGLPEAAARLAALEAACRRGQIARIDALARAALEPPLTAFRAEVLGVLRRIASPADAGVAEWLERLAQALGRCGMLATLQSDDAGRQVLAALQLDQPAAARAAWVELGGARTLSLPEFIAWVDAVFERATYRPVDRAGMSPQVIVTPLAQAIWRPFAALVLPGADDTQLGATPAPHRLLGDALLRELGLPDAAARRTAEAATFAQALSTAPTTLLRRRLDGREPRADSILVERLRLELQRRGADLLLWVDPRVATMPDAMPLERPAPPAAALLPTRLSASAAEALRACPYRFFALHLLGLNEDDELGAEVEKRDYGNWLHEVLRAFHAGREAPGPREAEMRRLAELGRSVQAGQGLDDAEFLPFAASFDAFVPRYITWLHERDAAGAVWREAESEWSLPLAGLEGIALHGVIDRIDSVPGETGRATELIDYKTGSASGLRDKLREPLEDTQLAFYAALVAPHGSEPLQAIYLALDSSRGIEAIRHPEVERSAAVLVEGLGHELARLRAGAGMPALGEGQTCDWCAARGLCRRDHWQREAPP